MISSIYEAAYFLGNAVNCSKSKGNFALTDVCPPTYPQNKWMPLALSRWVYHAEEKQNRRENL